MIEQKDTRYLLKTDKLPVYDLIYLSKVWGNIMQENEKLTNSLMYTNNIFKTSYNLQKHNRLNGMVCCYHMLRYGMHQAIEDLAYWKVKAETLEQLQISILQERTRLNINELRREENKKDEKTEDFEKIVVMVENFLERNLDIENTTVKKWIFILKSIDERARALEQLKKDGRQNHGAGRIKS